jgi:hypothetical protein
MTLAERLSISTFFQQDYVFPYRQAKVQVCFFFTASSRNEVILML